MAEDSIEDTTTPKRPKVRTFGGLTIPEKPTPPGPDECCMSACVICVYDLYQEALEDYRDSMALLREKLRAQQIPEDDWPSDVKEKKEGESVQDPLSDLDVSMSAFAELEKRLREQKT